MRTTIELSDALASRVRAFMKKRRTTLRAVVEMGIERVLDEQAPTRGFELREASFSGKPGFAPGVTADDVPQIIRELNDPTARRIDA
ncbi:MAG: hypothetical protein AAB426_01775 [Myxococcota bacterium]